MTIGGDGVANQLDNIRALPGVEKAAVLKTRHGELHVGSGYDLLESWGMLPSPTSEYLNLFMDVFELEVGRFPNNTSEITLARSTYERLEVNISSIVNLTVGWDEFGPIGRPLTVVGIYKGLDYDQSGQYYYFSSSVSGIGAVHPDIPWIEWEEEEVHADIDRTSITPFDAQLSKRVSELLTPRIQARTDGQNTMSVGTSQMP